MKTPSPLTSLCSVFAASALTAPGALLVYEGFDYNPASPDGARSSAGTYLLDGTGGTTEVGLSGTWNDLNGVSTSGGNTGIGDFYLSSQDFSFGNLATSGNYIRSDSNLNNDIMTRSTSVSLGSGTDLWFSFLAQNLDSRSASQGGFLLSNQAIVGGSAGQLPSYNASSGNNAGLNGIGIGSPGGGDWGAFGWDGSSNFTGGATISAPTDGTIRLLVGHVEFGGGTTPGNDKFSFYNYALSGSGEIDGGSLNLISSIDDINVDEASLNTLTIARQVNKAYDEIRIGETFDDVVFAIPEPSTALLAGLGVLALFRRRRD